MKLFTGWVMSAGLVLAAAAANAQVLAPYEAGRSPYAAVSDVEGPYAAMPPDAAVPRLWARVCCRRRRSTRSCARAGFRRSASRSSAACSTPSPVIDRGGDDGRLVIDARNGRIVRFMPAYRMGGNLNEDDGDLWPGRAAAADQADPRRAAAAGLRTACGEPHACGAAAEGVAGRAPAKLRELASKSASEPAPQPAARRQSPPRRRSCRRRQIGRQAAGRIGVSPQSDGREAPSRNEAGATVRDAARRCAAAQGEAPLDVNKKRPGFPGRFRIQRETAARYAAAFSAEPSITCGRLRAGGDRNAAGLLGLGNLANEIDMEQAVLERGVLHHHEIGKLEGAFEGARRDAAIQHLGLVLAVLIGGLSRP